MLPDGLDIIGARWFCDSCVEEVVFAENVREIGEEAFCAC